MQIVLTSEVLIAAYSQGLFPMAEKADSPYLHWLCPEKRGQLPIKNLHISQSLKKAVLKGMHDIRINTDFRKTIESCARKMPDRAETWINHQILEAFCKLHKEGYAHSVECWQNGEMVGGLYGLSLGGVFFGESMFSTVSDASKICLVHLAARLWAAGYELLDTQFINPHLIQFGAYEVSYKNYIQQLSVSLQKKCDFLGVQQEENQLVDDYFQQRLIQ